MERNSALIAFVCSFVSIVTVSCVWAQNIPEGNIETVQLPVQAVKNLGQWDSPIEYKIDRGPTTVCYISDGVLFPRIAANNAELTLPLESPPEKARALELRFVNPSPDMAIVPEEKTVTKTHFYWSSDSSEWRENVPSFKRITYRNVWDGVDITYYEKDGKLRQDFFVRDAKALGRIKIKTGSKSQLPFSHTEDSGDNEKVTINTDASGTAFLSANDTLPIAGFQLSTEFYFNFGGSGIDHGANIAVDKLGNLYATGITMSEDFPLRHSWLPALSHNDDSTAGVLLKLSCDGKTIIYSTYYAKNMWHWYYHYLPRIAVTSDNKAVMLSSVASTVRDLPVTADAMRKTIQPTLDARQFYDADLHLMQLSETGSLKYSSYIGTPGPSKIAEELLIDANDNIYLAGELYAYNSYAAHSFIDSTYQLWGTNPGFVPLDSIAYRRIGDQYIRKSFILKLPRTLDRISYGTYVFNSDHLYRDYNYWVNDDDYNNINIAVDSQGFIVYKVSAETTDGSIERPIVNPPLNEFCDVGQCDSYMMKFNPTDNRIVFAFYLPGGGYRGWDYANQILIDHNNNIVTGFSTEMMTLPVVRSMQNRNNGNHDMYLLKFTPSGSILQSTFIGSKGGEELSSIVFDRDENLIIRYEINTHIMKDSIPLTHRVRSFWEGISPFENIQSKLLIIDSSWSKILFSCNTFLGYEVLNYGHEDDPICTDPFGYLYFSETVVADDWWPRYNCTFKPFNPILPPEKKGWLLAKFRPVIYDWALPAWDVSLTVDTVLYSAHRHTTVPRTITVDALLKNIAPLNTAKILSATLIIPPSLYLSPITQSPVYLLPNKDIAPGDTVHARWTIGFNGSNLPDSITIELLCEYTWEELKTDCPIPFIRASKTIYIRKKQREYKLACNVDAPDTLTLATDGMSYLEKPVDIVYTIQNNDSEPVALGEVVLSIPKGCGAYTVPPGDTTRLGAVLQPGENRTYTWQLYIPEREYVRDIRLIVNAYDTLGFLASTCEKTITAPEVFGVTCETTGPQTITINSVTGLASPDTFSVFLRFINHIDTVIDIPDIRYIGLQSNHIDLLSSESSVRLAIVPALGDTTLQWRFAVRTPIISECTDSILFSYKKESSAAIGHCGLTVPIHLTHADPGCSISAPAALLIDNGNYSPTPFSVEFTLENNGTASIAPSTVTVQFPNYLATPDPVSVSFPAIEPDSSYRCFWNFSTLRSAYERDAEIIVTATTAEGSPIVACSHHVFVPALTDMQCQTQGTQHVVYKSDTKSYEPNPATVSLVVSNLIDTILTSVDAEIDVSGAAHLALSPGENQQKSAPVLSAGNSYTFDWSLDVLPADTALAETVIMRYRCATHPEWRECTYSVLLDAVIKEYRASCAAGGVDTLKFNQTGELLFPNPFQFYGAVTNTGTGPLRNCTGTVTYPPAFHLMPGESPTQSFGTIEPGETVAKSWLFAATASLQWLGTHTMQFSYAADQLQQAEPCTFPIVIDRVNETGLAISHVFLQFEALKDGPLPSIQSISVYAGTPTAMPWTAQGYPAWLDVRPSTGGSQTVEIQPTTTVLGYGEYSGTVEFISQAYNSPKAAQIFYRIRNTVGTEQTPAADGIELCSNFPNPFSDVTIIEYSLSAEDNVDFNVYNSLGTLVYHTALHAQPGRNRITVAGLSSGVYLYTLRAGTRLVSGRMIRK